VKITTPDWVKDAVFYQIFPDRFAKSERIPKQGLNLEPWESPPTNYGFKGGDLLGVLEHLDYLKELGITAIYFNPIFASAANHRYHTYDYYHVDPLLGGNEAFRQLLDAVHAHDIRIVLDGFSTTPAEVAGSFITPWKTDLTHPMLTGFISTRIVW